MRAPYCDDPVHVFSDDHCPASKDPSKPTPEETAALFAWSDRNKDRFIRSPEEEAEIERNYRKWLKDDAVWLNQESEQQVLL